MSPAGLIAKFLSDNSIGTLHANWSTGYAISTAFEPSEPANCVTVYDTEGGNYLPDSGYYEDRIQVRVRSKGYQDGHDKMVSIFNLLEKDNVCITVNAVSIVGVFSTSSIFPLGRDDNDLFLFTQNFKLLRETL